MLAHLTESDSSLFTVLNTKVDAGSIYLCVPQRLEITDGEKPEVSEVWSGEAVRERRSRMAMT